MPDYVIEKTREALKKTGKNIKDSKILVLGVAYKKNIGDDRESPAYAIMDLLMDEGVKVIYNDPYIPYLKKSRKYDFNLQSEPVCEELLKEVDAVIIVTQHDKYDYEQILKDSRLIIDTRGVYNKPHKNVVKA